VQYSKPFAFNRSDGVTSYVYADNLNRVAEITLSANGQSWGHDIISTWGGYGDPTGYVRVDLVNAVMFYDDIQNVWEASLSPGATNWTLFNLSSLYHEPVY
jgi:hypothetical protein